MAGWGARTRPSSLAEMPGHYKRSKFMAEQAALAAARAGAPVVIVNPSTPIGALDFKPTPTGRIIVDFLNRRMPAYLDTGLNIVDVEDVARGHLLAAERGRIGEKYILGGENLTLKEMLGRLADDFRPARAEDEDSVRGRVRLRARRRSVRAHRHASSAARQPDRGADGAQENVLRLLESARGIGLFAGADRRGAISARSNFSDRRARRRAPREPRDASAALHHRAAPVCVHLPRELSVHRDRELRSAHDAALHRCSPTPSRSRANGRRSTTDFRSGCIIISRRRAAARSGCSAFRSWTRCRSPSSLSPATRSRCCSARRSIGAARICACSTPGKSAARRGCG